MKNLLVAILICLINCGHAQTTLVGNQDGQWYTYANGAKSFLPKNIHDVGNFDDRELAYFMRYDSYGLINSQGEVVLQEQYVKAQQLKGGYYQFLRKDGIVLVKFENDEFITVPCLSLDEVDLGWYLARFKAGDTLVNTLNHVEIALNEDDRILESFYGYVLIDLDKKRHLYDPSGERIDMGGKFPLFTNGSLVIEGAEQQKVIYPDHTVDLPQGATNIKVVDDEIYYTLDDVTRIISSTDGQTLLEVKCDNLRIIGTGLFEMRKEGKVGVISRKGVVICPAKYSMVTLQENFIMVRTGTGLGVCDLTGKQLVPCKYYRLIPSRNFFLIESKLGFNGLYSRKSNREMLPCVYDQIMYSNKKIRAWSSGKMRILDLGEGHKVTSDLVLDNVITLDHDRNPNDMDVDERLFSLGWFMSSVTRYDSLGFKLGEKLKWGLKGVNDTLLLGLKYTEPTFVPGADFSLVPSFQMKIAYDGRNGVKLNTLSITSYRTGKMLINEPAISVDTSDLLTRSYSRFIGKNGPGFILSDNKILRAHYIDGFDSKYVRYCSGKKRIILPAEKKDADALKYPDSDLNNDPTLSIKYFVKNEFYEYIRFEEADWNFLDTAGNQVFAEPLDFAYPYRRNTAIVKKDGKWGVALEDSLVISPKFSSITRIPELADTIFLVRRTPGGIRYIDSMANPMSNGMTRFTMNRGKLSQIQMGATKVVIAPDYKIISGDTHFQKLFTNNIFYSKKSKEYTIYSMAGTLIGNTKMKPHEFIGEDYIIATSKGKKGVVSMDDEVLIPFIYKQIERHGNYIFAVNGGENILYDADLKFLKNCKSGNVLVDSISGNYAVQNGTKIIVYDINTGKKIGSWRGTKFSNFHNGWIVEKAKPCRIIHISGKEIVVDFQVKEVISMGASGYLVQGTGKQSHFYTPDWVEKRFKTPLKRAKYVGKGRAVCNTPSGLLLFGKDTEIWFGAGNRVRGEFSNGFLLLHQKGNCVFVNPMGENVFRREFKDATEFGTKYATVKEASGWTLMDAKGYFKALPVYEKITELGSNVFSTAKRPLYGLFDSHGSEIIPVEFQQINILNKNLIQGIKNGTFYYFNRQGKEIVLD